MKKEYLLLLILWAFKSHAMEQFPCYALNLTPQNNPIVAPHAATPLNSMAFDPSLETPLSQYLLQQCTHLGPSLPISAQHRAVLLSYFLATQYQLVIAYAQSRNNMDPRQEEQLWPYEAFNAQLSSPVSDLPDFFSMLDEIPPLPNVAPDDGKSQSSASIPAQTVSHEQPATGYVCKICKKSIDDYEHLCDHNRNAHGRCFSCRYCGYGEPAISAVERHVISVHLKLKPFKCSFCSKSFAYDGSRKSHEKKCNGRKTALP